MSRWEVGDSFLYGWLIRYIERELSKKSGLFNFNCNNNDNDFNVYKYVEDINRFAQILEMDQKVLIRVLYRTPDDLDNMIKNLQRVKLKDKQLMQKVYFLFFASSNELIERIQGMQPLKLIHTIKKWIDITHRYVANAELRTEIFEQLMDQPVDSRAMGWVECIYNSWIKHPMSYDKINQLLISVIKYDDKTLYKALEIMKSMRIDDGSKFLEMFHFINETESSKEIKIENIIKFNKILECVMPYININNADAFKLRLFKLIINNDDISIKNVDKFISLSNCREIANRLGSFQVKLLLELLGMSREEKESAKQVLPELILALPERYYTEVNELYRNQFMSQILSNFNMISDNQKKDAIECFKLFVSNRYIENGEKYELMETIRKALNYGVSVNDIKKAFTLGSEIIDRYKLNCRDLFFNSIVYWEIIFCIDQKDNKKRVKDILAIFFNNFGKFNDQGHYDNDYFMQKMFTQFVPRESMGIFFDLIIQYEDQLERYKPDKNFQYILQHNIDFRNQVYHHIYQQLNQDALTEKQAVQVKKYAENVITFISSLLLDDESQIVREAFCLTYTYDSEAQKKRNHPVVLYQSLQKGLQREELMEDVRHEGIRIDNRYFYIDLPGLREQMKHRKEFMWQDVPDKVRTSKEHVLKIFGDLKKRVGEEARLKKNIDVLVYDEESKKTYTVEELEKFLDTQPMIVRFFESLQKDHGEHDPVERTAFYFYKILEEILNASIEKDSEGLSTQERILINVCFRLSKCQNGQQEGIRIMYNDLDVHSSQKGNAKALAMIELSINEITENLIQVVFTGDGLLERVTKKRINEIGERVHQAGYIENRLRKQLFDADTPKFDRHSMMVDLPLLDIKTQYMMLCFFQEFTLQKLVDKIKRGVRYTNKAVDMIEECEKASCTDKRYVEYDDESFKTEFTDLSCLILLKSMGIVLETEVDSNSGSY